MDDDKPKKTIEQRVAELERGLKAVAHARADCERELVEAALQYGRVYLTGKIIGNNKAMVSVADREASLAFYREKMVRAAAEMVEATLLVDVNR